MVAARARASDHPFWLFSFSRTGRSDGEAAEAGEDEEAPASLARRSQAASAVASMPKRAQTSGATQL